MERLPAGLETGGERERERKKECTYQDVLKLYGSEHNNEEE